MNNTVEMNRYQKSVTAHVVVKNEDQWIWFAIMSVIDYIDKMIIFDTGSVDNTVDIINTIISKPEYKNKIYFEEVGEVSIEEFPNIRQRQIEMTDTDYILVLDGDEIWWEDGIKEFRDVADLKNPSLINIRFICPCTDMFHYRDFSRESYVDKSNGIQGSVSCRGMSMAIPGLHCSGDYGVEGYADEKGEFSSYDAVLLNNYYFHCSKLRRSSAKWGDESISYRRRKIFDDWDHIFPGNYKYPEVFYLNNRPSIVPDPFKSRDNLTKRISKRLVRIYRFLCKKDYVRIGDRK